MLSVKEIKEILREKDVKTIHLQFSDIHGNIKSLNLPSKQIDEILENKITFDGSSIAGFRENETLDLVLHPDPNTFMIFPFQSGKLKNGARFICDIHKSDGTPFEGCPRSNLKRIIQSAKDSSYTMNVGPEVEFFIFKMENGIITNTERAKSGYYDLSSNNTYNDMLMRVMMALEKSGFNVESLHHESAPYQYEIDLDYDEALKSADNFITFKYITKIITDAHGFKASFMPKPIYGKNGSGLHLNISLSKDNKNDFYDKNGKYQLSQTALYSIGSLLKNIKGITAVLNPTINSYKRLVKDYEAPIYQVWSVVTRSALVRIPKKRGESTRLELRSPDPAANPYLALAVILQTCLDGIRNCSEPSSPIEKNLFQFSSNEIKQRKIKSLPRNLFTALEEFEKSPVTRAALGDYIFEEFLYSKKKEWNEYRKQVTPWEFKKYLDV